MSISAIGGFSSAANLQAMREKMFSKLDQDGSGAISKDEFKTGPADAPKGAKPPGNVDEIFSKIDTDGNGELSKDELGNFKPTRPSQFSSSTMQSLLSVQNQDDEASPLDLASSDSTKESDQQSVSVEQMQQQFLEQILSKYSSGAVGGFSTLALA